MSVCGTGTRELARGFSWQHGIDPFGTYVSLPVTAQDLCVADLPTTLPTRLDRLFRQPAVSTLLRHPIAQTLTRWYRNFNLLSIGYGFRPHLRSRLTQSRSALLWKPWIFGQEDSHFFLATHTGILTSARSTTPSGIASTHAERSPTMKASRFHPKLRW